MIATASTFYDISLISNPTLKFSTKIYSSPSCLPTLNFIHLKDRMLSFCVGLQRPVLYLLLMENISIYLYLKLTRILQSRRITLQQYWSDDKCFNFFSIEDECVLLCLVYSTWTVCEIFLNTPRRWRCLICLVLLNRYRQSLYIFVSWNELLLQTCVIR